jgi:hypothetical protein
MDRKPSATAQVSAPVSAKVKAVRPLGQPTGTVTLIALIGNEAIALIVHPRGARFVSLRGTASDVLGNRVDQTILRAYGLTPR